LQLDNFQFSIFNFQFKVIIDILYRQSKE